MVKCHILGVAVLHDLLKVRVFIFVLLQFKLSSFRLEANEPTFTGSISNAGRANLSLEKRGGKSSTFLIQPQILY